MAKHSLFIDNATFRDKISFPKLRTPTNVVQDFARILKQYGDFQVLDLLVDETDKVINRGIEDLFRKANPGDLTLLYYSGHGYIDTDGEHYLIATNTELNYLLSTGISGSFIDTAMKRSRSRYQVIILDCYFSGVSTNEKEHIFLERLTKGATAILVSSGRVRLSFSNEDYRHKSFTKYLLEGIANGEADENGDGYISINELFHYANQKVRETSPEQAPLMELGARVGEIILTRSPVPKLPLEIELGLRSNFSLMREMAIEDLACLARGTDPDQASLAGEKLKQLRNDKDQLLLSIEATKVLDLLAKEQLDSQEGGSKDDRIRQSFELNLDSLPERKRILYLYLAIFPAGVPFPASVVSSLWALERAEATNILNELTEQGLLTKQQIGDRVYVTIHDLLHYFAIERMGTNLVAKTHQTLLASYRSNTVNNLWYSLPDDGYIYTYLSWHMEQAGWIEELHTMLGEETVEGQNGWFQTRDALGQGRVEPGYLTDVKRGLRLAEDAFIRRQSPIELARQVRYSLIIATLNSLVMEVIPPDLLAALVQKEIWPSAQALAYARQLPSTREQIKTLAELVPQLAKSGCHREALEAILEIKRVVIDDERTSQREPKLLRDIDTTESEEILTTLRGLQETDTTENEKILTTTIIKLAQCTQELPDSLREEGLTIARRNIRNKYNQTIALTTLATQCTGAAKREVLLEALNTAHKIASRKRRADALIELAPHLPEENLIKEAMGTVRDIRHRGEWIKFLERVGPYLPKIESFKRKIVEEILLAVRDLGDESSQATALIKLAPYLPEDLLIKEVLTSALGIRNKQSRTWALAGLVPFLPKELLRDALRFWPEANDNDLHRDETEGWRARALAKNCDYHYAVEVARGIADKELRAEVLAQLSNDLPRELKHKVLYEAFILTRQIDGNWNKPRLLALAKFICYLRQVEDEGNLNLPRPEELLEEVKTLVGRIKNESIQVKTLVELVPYTEALPDGEIRAKKLVRDAITIARKYASESDRIETLQLVSKLVKVGYPKEALQLMRTIGDTNEQEETLKEIGLQLTQLDADEMAISIGHNVGETITEIGRERKKTRTALTSQRTELPKAETDIVKRLITAIERDEQTKMLADLAKWLLKKNYLKEALTATQAIWNEQDRTLMLIELSQSLPKNLREFKRETLKMALTAAQGIEKERSRATALIELAQFLPKELKKQAYRGALAAAKGIPYEWERAKTLTEIARHLPESQRHAVLEDALAAVQIIEDEWAKAEAQGLLASLMVQLGLIRPGIRAAWMIKGDERAAWTRMTVLADLAPYLTGQSKENLLKEVLTTAQAIGIEKDLSEILTKISAELPDSLKQEALEIARTLDINKYRVAALTALVPYLPDSQKRNVLEEALQELIPRKTSKVMPTGMSDDDQAEALVRLAPHLQEKNLLQTALIIIRSINTEKGKTKALAGLIPFLPGPLLWEAFVSAGAIEARDVRAVALEKLAAHLIAFPRSELIDLWLGSNRGARFLSALATRTRGDLLSDLRALTPLITALGGEEALKESARAIQDVGRWWP